MNKTELLNRLSDIEWDDFEVKESRFELPKNIWESVGAFANSAGGWIVLGILQNGKKFEVQGVENSEKIEQDFTTALRSRGKFNVLINPICKKYNIDGKFVLAFFIPSSEQKPVYFNSLQNTFIRTGSGDQRATDSEINALFRDQLFGVMSARPVKRTTIKNLNRITLARYRDYMLRSNPSSSYNNLTEEDFLRKLQITEGKHLTYGGLLFMGNNLAINQMFPDFRVDLLEIPGRSYAEADPRYTFRLEEQENLWEYYFALIERLRRHIKNIPYKLDVNGVGIEDSPEFDAIREAVVNLLMHCDYFSPMKPRIRIFSDRIEFENPGAFPRPISELLIKDVSIPRNPVLTKLFRNVKLADNAGIGFDKMLKWERETQTKVIFEGRIDMALVTFHFGELIKKRKEIEGLNNEIEGINEELTQNEELNEGLNEEINSEIKGLTQNEGLKSLRQIISEHQGIQAKDISIMLDNRPIKTIERQISVLIAKNLIERRGSKKTGGYWLIEK